MSNRNSRAPPSSNVPPTQSSSKLPKFLQKQANRDRSRSVTDPARSVTSLASGSSSSISPEVPPTPSASKPPCKSSIFLSINRDKDDKSRRSSDVPSPPSEMGAMNNEMEEPPTAATSSPKGKNPLLTAKHGKGHLDKAMRYLLDSDSMPDKCTDLIWLLGVQHPWYELPPLSAHMVMPTNSLSSSTRSWRDSGSFRSSASSISHLSTSSTAEQLSLSLSQSSVIPLSSKHVNPAANWPPAFYADFTSRVANVSLKLYADTRHTLGGSTAGISTADIYLVPGGDGPTHLPASSGLSATCTPTPNRWSTPSRYPSSTVLSSPWSGYLTPRSPRAHID